MIDKFSQKFFEPILKPIGSFLLAQGLKPNHISFFGLVFAVFSGLSIYYSYMLFGLFFIYLNRICDGLDGEMARQTEITNYGGFIDIVFDFIFYAIIPFSFALQKEVNSLPALLLIASFLVNGVSFLAYAAIMGPDAKTDNTLKKSFYYSNGLVEGSETILFFTLFCLFPDKFPVFGMIFFLLVWVTIFQRLYKAKQDFNT